MGKERRHRGPRHHAWTFGACIATTMVLLVVGPALACTPGATISSEPARGEAGTSVSLSGTGFDPVGSPIAIKWAGPNGRLLATTNPAPSGTFAASVVVPADARTGYQQLSAVQTKADGGTATASFAFMVQARTASPSTPVPGPAPGAPSAAPTPAATPEPVATAAAPVEPAPPTISTPQVPQATAPRPTGAPSPAPPALRSPATARPSPERLPASATSALAPTSGEAAASGAVATANASPVLADPAPLAGLPPVPVAPAAAENAALAASGSAENGGDRSVWVLVPLITVGALLFAAAAAVVVHEAREKRARVRA